MGERYTVAREGALFEVLARELPDWNRNTLRRRLKAGCVLVNGEAVHRGDHPLAAGDELRVLDKGEGRPAPSRPRGLVVLHEDEHLVAIDKPAGLLSVSTDRQRERTALARLREALSRPGRPARLWPVHRLDRETSGVLLFARSREACELVRADWRSVRKTYAAVVEGRPRPSEGWIDEPLEEDRALFVRVARTQGAKPARTHYSTVRAGRDRALLEVELDTGRRHQIRAHMAWLGHPIVGDDRYGTRGPRMALHARALELRHPSSGRRLVVEAATPREVEALVGPAD